MLLEKQKPAIDNPNLPPSYLTGYGPSFRLVKSVERWHGETLETLCSFSGASLAYLQDHLPGTQVVPGAFLIEACAQSASILAAFGHVHSVDGGAIRGTLARVNRAVFWHPVYLSETVRVFLERKRATNGFGEYVADIHSDTRKT